jgi:hypothetical protein
MRPAVLSAVFLVAFLATQASAERLTRPVTDVTTVSRGVRGGSEIAFHWDPAIAQGDVAVRHAFLRFNLAGEPVDRTLTVRAYPVTSPWSVGSPNVTFDEELWSRAEIDLRRAGPVVIDLTTLVKEVVEEGQPYYGFVITAGPGEGDGLSEAETARFAGLSSATMDVTWRRTPEPPAAVRPEGQRQRRAHGSGAQG